MSNAGRQTVTESSLKANMNELAHAQVRDLAIACKKTAIYNAGHPQSLKAVDKAFVSMGQVFRFKQTANLNVEKGFLYSLNIGLKDTVFNAEMLSYLQLLDISSLVFFRSLNANELAFLVENMVQRISLYDPTFSISACLKEKGIRSIEANSRRATEHFENSKKYPGRYDGDFSLKRFVFDQLGSDLSVLARAFVASNEELLSMGIDYDPDIVKYLLPEKVATLGVKETRGTLVELEENISGREADDENRPVEVDEYMTMMTLLEYHPKRALIVDALVDVCDGNDHGRKENAAKNTSSVRIESLSRVDRILDGFFAADTNEYRDDDFADAFHRLLTTSQKDKAEEVVTRLMDLMTSPETTPRQIALRLLIEALDRVNLTTNVALLDFTVNELDERISLRLETFEYSEFIWKLFEKCLKGQQFDHLAVIASAMASRRQLEGNVTVYDSMAVKKAFEYINQPEVLQELVSRLAESNRDEVPVLRNLMVAIGSEEMALALSSIISHEERQVRQQVLKIVSELGKSALKVFTGILVNESYFDRDFDRHELADAKWWVVRNSIFILGLLGDREGIMPLRLRLSDHDPRVRREIVSALGKIGGEDAVDCLIFMAEDPVKEIRENAIIAIGLIGDSDSAPLLIDVVRRTKTEVLKTVAALARLGGREARTFLCQMLEEDESLTLLAGGKVSKEELRVAIVRALGQIGDGEAISKIKEYQETQNSMHKLFFKNSPVNKAIEEILASR